MADIELSQKDAMLKAIEKRENYSFSTRVDNIVKSDTFADRITIVLVDEIAQINKDDATKIDIKNSFSKNIYEAIRQIAQFSDYAKLAQAAAMGKMISPQFFAYLLKDADIEIERVFCKKGSPRRDGVKGTYPADTYTTIIKKIVTHISPLFTTPMLDTEKGKLSVLMNEALNPISRPKKSEINTDNI